MARASICSPIFWTSNACSSAALHGYMQHVKGAGERERELGAGLKIALRKGSEGSEGVCLLFVAGVKMCGIIEGFCMRGVNVHGKQKEELDGKAHIKFYLGTCNLR